MMPCYFTAHCTPRSHVSTSTAAGGFSPSSLRRARPDKLQSFFIAEPAHRKVDQADRSHTTHLTRLHNVWRVRSSLLLKIRRKVSTRLRCVFLSRRFDNERDIPRCCDCFNRLSIHTGCFVRFRSCLYSLVLQFQEFPNCGKANHLD